MNKLADIKPDAASRRSPYFSEEHEMLREQVRRFVETEIKPHALAWEQQGCVPREVLRRMGIARLFRHPLSGATTAAPTWIRSAPSCSPKSSARSTFSRRRHHRAGPFRHGLGPCLQLRQRGAEGQMDAQHHRRRGRFARSPLPSPMPAPTSKASAPPRAAMATAMSSMAPRCSSPTAYTPIFIASRRRPPATAAAQPLIACFWWRRARRAFA